MKINEYLNRTGNFGDQLHAAIDKLPQYSLQIQLVPPNNGDRCTGLNDREDEVVRGEEAENPVIKLGITITCLSLEEESHAKKHKSKKNKRLKGEQFWSKNLTILVLRSDGKLVCNLTMP